VRRAQRGILLTTPRKPTQRADGNELADGQLWHRGRARGYEIGK
jgi:hypothetical protein